MMSSHGVLEQLMSGGGQAFATLLRLVSSCARSLCQPAHRKRRWGVGAYWLFISLAGALDPAAAKGLLGCTSGTRW